MVPQKYIDPSQKMFPIDHDLAELLKDSRLSKEEKLKALDGWENAQEALLRADDENMGRKTAENTAPPSEKIRHIQKAGRELFARLCVSSTDTTFKENENDHIRSHKRP